MSSILKPKVKVPVVKDVAPVVEEPMPEPDDELEKLRARRRVSSEYSVGKGGTMLRQAIARGKLG